MPRVGRADFLHGGGFELGGHQIEARDADLLQGAGGGSVEERLEGTRKDPCRGPLNRGIRHCAFVQAAEIERQTAGDQFKVRAVVAWGWTDLIQITDIGGLGFQKTDGIQDSEGDAGVIDILHSLEILRIEPVDVFQHFDQQLAPVGRQASCDGLTSIPEAPEGDLVDAPCGSQLLEEFQDPRRAENVEIAAGIPGGEVRRIVLEKRDGPKVDRLPADDRWPELAGGDDPVVVRVGWI